MGKYKTVIAVVICFCFYTGITLAEPQIQDNEPNQPHPIKASDIKEANYSPYLSYLKEHAKSPVEYVLGKFKDHDVVILGEMHEQKENLELVCDLIEPLYHKAGVKSFAMETLKSKNISLVNQLVTSVEYDQQLALRIFRDQGWPTWGFKEYMDVIKAVWELNNKLPPQAQKVKVVPLSSDWDAYDIVSGAWTEANEKAHDNHMAQILSSEVLEKGEKALVLIGYNHSFTHYRQPRFKDGKLIGERHARFGYILHRKYGDRIFQVCLHLRHRGPKVVTKQPTSGHPILVGFMEKMFEANNDKPVGFDVENSPFACLRDKGSYYFAFQKDVVFSDIAQGYIFLKPLDKLSRVTWVKGFIDESNFERAKTIALKRGWIKPQECKTPQELDKEFAILFR